MRNDIFERVVRSVCEIASVDPQVVKADMSLESPEIGMSSLDIVTLLVQLEEIYNIQFPDSPLDIKVIQNIVAIIETKLSHLSVRSKKISNAFENLFGKDA